MLESPSMRGWDRSEAWRARARAMESAAQSHGVEAARALWLRDPMFDTLRPNRLAFAAFAASALRYSGRHWLGDDPQAPPRLPDVERLHELQTPTLLVTGARDVEDIHLIAQAIADIAPRVMRQGSLRVRPGERLEAGAQIGEVGNTGNSDEPHLHVSVQRPSGDGLFGAPVQVTFQGRYLARHACLAPR
jgi:hypothetical protein